MSTPIPKVPGIPLLGNIFDVDPNNTWTSLKKLAEKYGEIFQITVLGHTIVFVASAALAEELCDESRFRKYVGGPIVEIRYAVHDALFTAYNDEPSWGIAHRIFAPLLQSDAVASTFDDTRDAVSALIAKWTGLGTSGNINDGRKKQTLLIINELNRLTLEVTTLTLFGKRLHCLDGPEHPALKGMEDATSEAMKRPIRPSWLNWLMYDGKFRAATQALRAYAADIVQHRKDYPSDRQDLLWAMLHGRDLDTGHVLSDSQIVDEIVSMPIGSSTTPCLVATALYFLLKNPDCAAAARRELDTVVGVGPLAHEHLTHLPYTTGVLREALRLSFAAPGFNIEPIPGRGEAPVLLGGGKYAIAHNQPMIIVLSGVNRDPEVFDEPRVFRPERMMGAAFNALPLGARRWFGNGKRECIGKHWAWQFGMVTLAKLLMEVDFEMADPKYDLKQDGWFNVRPVNFYIRVKPRGDQCVMGAE